MSHLPRGQLLTFVLLTQCIPADGHANACAPALSSPLTVTRPSAHPPSPPFAFDDLLPLANITRIANDTQVRADFATLFNLTNGPEWLETAGWLDPTVSVCDWSGLQCDAFAGTTLTSIELSSNGLNASALDLEFLFVHISTLQGLDLSNNPALGLTSLNLAHQSALVSLQLSGLNLTLPTRVTLPAVCLLTSLTWATSQFQLMNPLESITFPVLQTITFADDLAPAQPFPFPAVLIMLRMPSLQGMNLRGSAIDTTTPDPSGRTGGALMHHWWENLDVYNPQLNSLAWSSVYVTFDRTPGESNNVPRLNSSTLATLSLALLPLRTTGAALSWSLPALTSLELNQMPAWTFYLASLVPSVQLSTFHLRHVTAVGDLQLLFGLATLTDVLLFNTQLVTSLPSNVSATWPALAHFSLLQTTVVGGLPTFANLAQLMLLQLADCDLVGVLPAGFLSGCPLLTQLEISSNPRLGGPLPNLVELAPNLQSLVLQLNAFEDDLGVFLSTAFPALTSLSVGNQRLYGQLPTAMWETMPLLFEFIALQNDLSGPIPTPLTPRYLMSFSLSYNPRLVGQFPSANLTAFAIDLSHTGLSGPFTLQQTDAAHPIEFLSIGFTQITCPLMLQTPQLTTLLIQNAGFGGCDFNNNSQIQIPTSVQTIDVRTHAHARARAHHRLTNIC